MTITIIMPIYNGEKYLKRSIESVLNQSHQDIELILINDGSRDRSLNICKKYKKQDNRVVLIDIPNSGPGYARNKGLDQARGDYISFLDADDWLKSDTLATLLLVARQKKYDIVSSNHFRVDKKITVSKNSYKTSEINKKEGKNYHKFKTSSSFGYVWGKLYKTSFIRQNNIRFTEEKKAFLEDNLFNLKAISYRPRYYVLNEPLYYYNVSDDSISNKKEDITARAINMLETYEVFLNQNNKYNENLDLFIPLGGRVIAWSLMKTMEKKLDFKELNKKVLEFSNNETVRRLFSNRNRFKELIKIDSIAQVVLYSFVMIGIHNKWDKILTGFFYINNPLFKLYIKRSLKS